MSDHETLTLLSPGSASFGDVSDVDAASVYGSTCIDDDDPLPGLPRRHVIVCVPLMTQPSSSDSKPNGPATLAPENGAGFSVTGGVDGGGLTASPKRYL